MSESRTITIHPEWKDLCRKLSELEGYCMLHNIMDYVLYGKDIADDENYKELYDRYERYVWETIRNDIMNDRKEQ